MRKLLCADDSGLVTIGVCGPPDAEEEADEPLDELSEAWTGACLQ